MNEKKITEHPNPDCRKAQQEFLEKCPPELLEFHSLLFKVGNITHWYYEETKNVPDKILSEYYKEWLVGLPDNIRTDMKSKGFDYCKNTIPFLRYVNERQDIGFDEWIKKYLSPTDYQKYMEMVKRDV